MVLENVKRGHSPGSVSSPSTNSNSNERRIPRLDPSNPFLGIYAYPRLLRRKTYTSIHLPPLKTSTSYSIVPNFTSRFLQETTSPSSFDSSFSNTTATSSTTTTTSGNSHHDEDDINTFEVYPSLPRNNPYIGTKRYSEPGLSDLFNDSSSTESSGSVLSRMEYLASLSDEERSTTSKGSSNSKVLGHDSSYVSAGAGGSCNNFENGFTSSNSSSTSISKCVSCGEINCASCGLSDWSFVQLGGSL